MVKPINEFGGWLTFFKIYLWIQFISALVGGISIIALLIVSFFKFSNNTIDSSPVNIFGAVTLICFIIFSFLSFYMIKLLKQKEATTPHKIVQILLLYILVKLIFVAFIGVFNNLLPLNNTILEIIIKKRGLQFLKSGIATMLYCIIWIAYLNKSKRVFAYYGKNAGAKN